MFVCVCVRSVCACVCVMQWDDLLKQMGAVKVPGRASVHIEAGRGRGERGMMGYQIDLTE